MQIRNFRFLFIVSILVALKLSCDKYEPIPNSPKERSIRDIGIDEIPEIESLLSESLALFSNSEGNRFQVNDANSILDLEIDWSKIVELVDTLGNTNYSIAIKDEANAPYTFHNLVVGKTPDGDLKKPFLMTYIMSPEFRDIYDQTLSIQGFTGTAKKRFINFNSNSEGNSSAPFSLGSTSSNDTCPRETQVDNDGPGPSGGGSGGGGGGGGGGAPDAIPDEPGGSYSVCYSYWIDFPSESCGYNCVTASRSILVTDCQSYSYSSSDMDLCDDDDEVPVIDPNEPCPGDPLQNMEVASSGASGKRGGTFGYTRANGKDFHDGVDLKASPGTGFKPILPGTVVAVENTFRSNTYKRDSYGNYITVRSTLPDGSTIDISYNHLSNTYVSIGDNVTTDTTLGKTGRSGNAASKGVVPHLHVKARVRINGQPLPMENPRNNPALYMSSTINIDGSIIKNPCRL